MKIQSKFDHVDPVTFEQRCAIAFNDSRELQAEFGDVKAYSAFVRAEARGSVRILSATGKR